MTTPTFGLCPRKQAAREATILAPWRTLSGQDAIPAKQQYWTLCGPMADLTDTSSLQPNCELLHVTRSKLVKPSQFHGVECEEDTYNRNLNAVASLPHKPFLHLGDIVNVLDAAYHEGWLLPAIVNLDFMVGPAKAMTPLARVIALLNLLPAPQMVVLNVAIRRYGLDLRTQFSFANSHPALLDQLEQKNWEEVGSYTYRGTGRRSTTQMQSIVLWRGA